MDDPSELAGGGRPRDGAARRWLGTAETKAPRTARLAAEGSRPWRVVPPELRVEGASPAKETRRSAEGKRAMGVISPTSSRAQ